jgi:hypothetical protein
LTSTGTAITYADSATAGASFTINEDGIYSIYYSDISSAGDVYVGVSVNSSQLTTNITNINIADRLILSFSSMAAYTISDSRTVRLSSGDVVRPHTLGANNGASNQVFFSIAKVGT